MITAFIGTTELLLIGGLALLLVGGKKLPEMMRGLGKGVREFKDGMKEGTSDEVHPDDTDDAGHTEPSSEPDAGGDSDSSSDPQK